MKKLSAPIYELETKLHLETIKARNMLIKKIKPEDYYGLVFVESIYEAIYDDLFANERKRSTI